MNYAKVCLRPFRKNSLKLLFSKTFFPFLFVDLMGLELAEFHRDMVSKLLCENKQVFFQASRGHGKCFGEGTKIMMFDGSFKNAEDIIVGDLLMGDDSKPRTVLETHSGFDDLFEIKPRFMKSDSYVVNKEHILCLAERLKNNDGFEYKEMAVKDYINELDWKKKDCYRQYKAKLDFSENKHLLDPYFLGLWLGDGSSREPRITNMDIEVINYLYGFAKNNGLRCRKHPSKKTAKDYVIISSSKKQSANFVRNELNRMNLIKNKHIPREYLFDSEENRLKLLAGLIDTDGFVSNTSGYINGCEICFSNKRLVDDVVFLLRSLGYMVSVHNKPLVNAYRIMVYGDLSKIPCLVKRKKVVSQKLYKSTDKFSFDVVPKEKGKYYGFEVDGNHKFLLSDFTVVHNSELVSVGFIIHLLLTQGSNKTQPFQICLVSSTDDQTVKLFQRIKNYIEGTPCLREVLYPNNIHSAKWNEREIITKNNVHLIGRNMGSAIRGLHVNVVVLDDILSDEISNINGAKEVFYGIIFPIVQTKKGRMIVVGTPISFDDLFADLWDEEKFPNAIRGFYPARKPDGSPMWSTHFSDEKLLEIENNMGPIKWSREYMLKPIGAGSMLFDENLVLASIDSNCKFTDKNDSTQYFLGCDFALSSEKSADFSAFVVIEKNVGKPLRVVDIWHKKGVSAEEQIEIIKKLHLQYNFSKIVAEKMGLSYGIVGSLETDSFTRSVVEGFVTTTKTKEDILSRLHVLMKNKGLRFDDDKDLIGELLTFGVKKKRDGSQTYESLGKHDDLVMALAMACFAADQYQSQYDFAWV